MKRLADSYRHAVEEHHRHRLPPGAPDFHPAVALSFGALLVGSLALPTADALLNDRKITKALIGENHERVANVNRPSLYCDDGRGVFKLNDRLVSVSLVPFSPCEHNKITADDFNPPLK